METYDGQIISGGWYVTEKFDGVCGTWDGKRLVTRTHNTIHAPQWWLDSLPKTILVGELWTGRGKFDDVRAIVSRKTPRDDEWETVIFIVFGYVGPLGIDLGPQAHFVTSKPINTWHDAEAFYSKVLAAGGEGVVFTSPSGEQFKHKPFQDDEGTLVSIKMGSGRNSQRAGSFILKLRNGKYMALGGLNDAVRENPPAIGSVINFIYQGRTSKGLPRFARYAGIRAETSLEF